MRVTRARDNMALVVYTGNAATGILPTIEEDSDVTSGSKKRYVGLVSTTICVISQ